MKMPSVMGPNKQFAKVPQANIPRSTFNRSHGYKTTFDQGYLIPVLIDEVVPGDTFNCQMTAFARLSTPIKPIMDNMYLDSFFFFVPYRLLWSNFVKMMGEQQDPGDSISYTIPQATVPAGGYNTGTWEDYAGLPVGVGAGAPAWSHSALPRRAYYRIFNEWFRDENLVNHTTAGATVGDGPDVIGAGGSSLRRRGKRHDYFTSCLPWQQKGDAVALPLGATNPVEVAAASTAIGVTTPAGGTRLLNDAGASNIQATATSGGTPLFVDMTNTLTINELRESVQIQKLLERSARGGTRYPESIRAHFGVEDPQFAVLQRPEYLGGGSAPININPVAQQAATDTGTSSQTVQGNLAAIGTMVANNHGFVKSFTEHGLVMGLVSVRCDLSYQQGLERWWSRETRYEMYYPEFAHLGEQSVLNKEIYTQGVAADDSAFGYQERFAEMRYKPSRITGQFRSNPAGGAATLEVWHLAEDFSALPTLNSTFVEDNIDVDRIIATPTEPHFFFDAWFDYKCTRPMPVFSVPGMIDHL